MRNTITLLDGAMGTMLQKQGLKLGHLPELLCLEQPQLITGIHRQYVEAGSQIIYSNTFGANRLKLRDSGHSVEAFCIIESVNPDEESENHLDGETIRIWK